MNYNVIDIGKNREVFWDDYLIDKSRTTAFHRIMPPTEKGCCFVFDKGEQDCALAYFSVVKVDDIFRMYYLLFDAYLEDSPIRMHVIESKDGVNWYRPKLDIFPHPELETNNVVIDKLDDSSMCVFYDTNPDCPDDEKYKAITLEFINGDPNFRQMVCYVSPDGYHFTRSHIMTKEGRFDTLNSTFWKDGKYYCFIRDLHWRPERTDIVRDVRVTYSTDFRNWSKPELIKFFDDRDDQLYTNNIMRDPRVPNIFIGMPTRYTDRVDWTPNEEQMASNKIKEFARQSSEIRYGTALTDCIFICSRDGHNWYRYNEAYITPGMETEDNWVYGDCYPSYNLLDPGGNYYYIYTYNNSKTVEKPMEMIRYEIRKDGYACIMAGGDEEILVTKPIMYDGKDLHINFSTSCLGYIAVEVLDMDGNSLSKQETFEAYGDTLDRKLSFLDGSDFSAYAGKGVRLRFRMRDAKLFSFYFE